jgi:hypothetical protein
MLTVKKRKQICRAYYSKEKAIREIGSFNWLMRTLTGALFGIGLVWFAYPQLKAGFNDTRDAIVRKFNKAEMVASSEHQDMAPPK